MVGRSGANDTRAKNSVCSLKLTFTKVDYQSIFRLEHLLFMVSPISYLSSRFCTCQLKYPTIMTNIIIFRCRAFVRDGKNVFLLYIAQIACLVCLNIFSFKQNWLLWKKNLIFLPCYDTVGKHLRYDWETIPNSIVIVYALFTPKSRGTWEWFTNKNWSKWHFLRSWSARS